MIDKQILDEVLPIPELEELKESTVEELKAAGFVITNFHSGGVFYTLLMIVLRIKIEFTELLRTVLNNMFISHASGPWLDLKLADYSKKRKKPQKTQGRIKLSRSEDGESVPIAKGQVFKTAKDINGEELRFFTLEAAVLPKEAQTVDILVEAEKEGARYNVPQGQITRSLTHIGGGVNAITNAADWITREGSDTEDHEAFRSRGLRSWAELAQRPIADAYKNAAERVVGVLFAQVDDQLPRGQGTLDIIVTSTAGTASESLLEAVRAEVDTITGPCDDILVKSSVTVTQPLSVTITISAANSAEEVEIKAMSILASLFAIRKNRDLNVLIHADVIHALKGGISGVKNVKVTVPAEDTVLETDQVLLLGEVTVTIQRG